MCSIVDFPLLWCCKLFKFYTLCRCHQVADDGSVAHEHIHAVVSGGIKLKTWKQQLSRKNIKLHKTTFKKILCGDHLCGVIRYICCADGQKSGKRGSDGLVLAPHTHYERRVDCPGWLHNRGKYCCTIRNNIEDKMKLKLDVPLHDFEKCMCDRGKVGLEKIKEANRKRKAFYETEEGKAIKKKYKEIKQAKEDVIKRLIHLGSGVKAELLRNEMARLIKLL